MISPEECKKPFKRSCKSCINFKICQSMLTEEQKKEFKEIYDDTEDFLEAMSRISDAIEDIKFTLADIRDKK